MPHQSLQRAHDGSYPVARSKAMEEDGDDDDDNNADDKKAWDNYYWAI